MSTMVTGGLGYVGRHLVSSLAGRGENVVYVQGELTTSRGSWTRHDAGRGVHTATMSHPDLSVGLPISRFTATVEGTAHVSEAARMVGV